MFRLKQLEVVMEVVTTANVAKLTAQILDPTLNRFWWFCVFYVFQRLIEQHIASWCVRF